LKPNTWNSCW